MGCLIVSNEKITPSPEALAAMSSIEDQIRQRFNDELNEGAAAANKPPSASQDGKNVESQSFAPSTVHSIQQKGILEASRQKVTRPRVNARDQYVKAPSLEVMKRNDEAR